MSFHEGSNWQARKEDEGKPLYSNPQPPLPEQGKEGDEKKWTDQDLEDNYNLRRAIVKRDTDVIVNKYCENLVELQDVRAELAALKSRPSEGWSDELVQDYVNYSDNWSPDSGNMAKPKEWLHEYKLKSQQLIK